MCPRSGYMADEGCCPPTARKIRRIPLTIRRSLNLPQNEGGVAAGDGGRDAALLPRDKFKTTQLNIYPSEIPPALVFNRFSEKNKPSPSNSNCIYLLLCRSGRGRPPLFFSRKEKGERNDRGRAPLTPEQVDVYVRLSILAVPREAYFVAMLRRQQKAAWCFPRKLCSRPDRYVS